MAGTAQPPVNADGNVHDLKKKGLRMGGGILNYGFIAGDTALRVKDGEAMPVALGKALLTNAAFSLIPGGILGMAAVGAAMVAPMAMNGLDQAAGALGAKKQQFGGNFTESAPQVAMMQQGVGNMQNARMQNTKRMANHARGAQKVY